MSPFPIFGQMFITHNILYANKSDIYVYMAGAVPDQLTVVRSFVCGQCLWSFFRFACQFFMSWDLSSVLTYTVVPMSIIWQYIKRDQYLNFTVPPTTEAVLSLLLLLLVSRPLH